MAKVYILLKSITQLIILYLVILKMQASQVQTQQCIDCRVDLSKLQQKQFRCKKCLQKQSQALSKMLKNRQIITQDLMEQFDAMKKYKQQIERQETMSLNSAIYLDEDQFTWSFRCQGFDIEQSVDQLQKQLKELEQQQVILDRQTQKTFKKIEGQTQTIKKISQKVDSYSLQLKNLILQHIIKMEQHQRQKDIYLKLSSDNLLSFIYNISFEDQNGLINSEIISETNKNIWMIAEVANFLIKKALDLNYSVLAIIDIQTNSQTNSGISVQQTTRKHVYSRIKLEKAVSASEVKKNKSSRQSNSLQHQHFQTLTNEDESQTVTEISLKEWEKWLPIVCQELNNIHQFLCSKYFKGKNFKPPYQLSDNGRLIGGVVIGQRKSSNKAIKRVIYFLKHIMNLFFYLSEF